MHLRFGSHSLERTQHGLGNRYLGQAILHDNLRETLLNYAGHTSTNGLTVPTYGSKPHGSPR
jgi:hypothetical protein